MSLMLLSNRKSQDQKPKLSKPTTCTNNQKLIFKRGQLLRYQAFKYQQKNNLAPIQQPPISYQNKLINQDPFYNSKVYSPNSPQRLSTQSYKFTFEACSQTEDTEEKNFLKFFDAKTLMLRLQEKQKYSQTCEKFKTQPSKNKSSFDYQQPLVSPCAQPQFYSKISRSQLRKKTRTQSDFFFVRSDEYKQQQSQLKTQLQKKQNTSVIQQFFEKESDREGRIINKIKEHYSQKQSPTKLLNFQNDKLRNFSIQNF